MAGHRGTAAEDVLYGVVEAGLDATDISYQKGCYIGQEVISRIKSAGKVNRKLLRFAIDVVSNQLVDASGHPAGELISVSPHSENGIRLALGYVKRGVETAHIIGQDGIPKPSRLF